MARRKVLALLVVVLAACDRSDIDGYPCLNPDKGHLDASGQPDPCHLNDPDAGAHGDAGAVCDGVCVPGFPVDWNGPALVWMGAEAEAPPCPAAADIESFTLHGDPGSLPPLCGACTCAPPVGACSLPTTVTTSSSNCPGTGFGVFQIPFDPPAAWGGTCTAPGTIPSGLLCGGVPCVKSITIAPMVVKESECQPIEPPHLSTTPPSSNILARICNGSPRSASCGQSDVCAPATPTPGFKHCISRVMLPGGSDGKCPPSYPSRGVFYENFVDTRTCAPCKCEKSSGSTCTGSLSIFKDGLCGAAVVASGLIDAIEPKCHDVPLGIALGSMSASEPSYAAGSCPASGGEEKEGPAQFPTLICCRETP